MLSSSFKALTNWWRATTTSMPLNIERPLVRVVHWVSGELDFITGLVSGGDWAPNDQIGRLDG